MLRTQVVIAFLLGAVVALGAALVVTTGRGLPEAYGQTAGNNEMIAIVGNGEQGKSKEILFVIDSRSMRMGIYEFSNQQLSLMAIRNMQYDMKFEEFAPRQPQVPTVKEVRDATRDEDKPGTKKK